MRHSSGWNISWGKLFKLFSSSSFSLKTFEIVNFALLPMGAENESMRFNFLEFLDILLLQISGPQKKQLVCRPATSRKEISEQVWKEILQIWSCLIHDNLWPSDSENSIGCYNLLGIQVGLQYFQIGTTQEEKYLK